MTQKNPSVFHRPQKITFGQNFRPKKITLTPSSLKYMYVSEAPWMVGLDFVSHNLLIMLIECSFQARYRKTLHSVFSDQLLEHSLEILLRTDQTLIIEYTIFKS